MVDDFLANPGVIPVPDPDESGGEWERLLVLVIGSSEGTIDTIHNLHARGFAEVSAWSPLLQAPYPREVVSILSRRRKKHTVHFENR